MKEDFGRYLSDDLFQENRILKIPGEEILRGPPPPGVPIRPNGGMAARETFEKVGAEEPARSRHKDPHGTLNSPDR